MCDLYTLIKGAKTAKTTKKNICTSKTRLTLNGSYGLYYKRVNYLSMCPCLACLRDIG